MGCTSAGEIGPAGLSEHSLSGISFSAKAFSAVVDLLPDLEHFETRKTSAFVQKVMQELEAKTPFASVSNCFGFMLIDGLSGKEEPVAYTLQTELGKIPLIGGSAGDGLQLSGTYVFFNGEFHADSAVLLLMATTLPFKIFKTQHFMPTDERMVVTAADVEHRVVFEINGLPAAEEYARLVGVSMDELNPDCFAASPIVVIVDNTYYVRAIRGVNPDHSLSFFCAIEEGLVLRIAGGVDLLDNLQQTLAGVTAQWGKPQLILACDCILRKLEIVQHQQSEHLRSILADYQVVGFNTYGEQYCGVHVNQTFVAIAIGYANEASSCE